jgi:hypothetical protein
MAEKISLKKELSKKVCDLPNVYKSEKIDVSEEGLLLRAKSRERFPTASYINTYQVTERRLNGSYTIDLTELKKKYPHNEIIISQLIVGANAILSPGNTKNTINSTFDGVRLFVEFINSDRNLSNIRVINILDINVTVAQSFCNYLINVYPKDTRSRKWFSAVKRIVERLQELYPNEPNVGRSFAWPKGPGVKEGMIEGYHPRQMKELWEACIDDINSIINFHETYLKLDEELYTEDWSLENIMYLLKLRWNNPAVVKQAPVSSPYRVNRILKFHFQKPSGKLLNKGYTYEELYNIYMQNGLELASRGRLPTQTRILQNADKERATKQFNMALATLRKRFPMFPYYYNYVEARDLLSKEYFKNILNNPLCPMINSISIYSSYKIDFMKGILGMMAIYAAMHFVIDTLYPFLLLCLINTGWNLESILSISDNVDSHATPDLIDPDNYILIHGDKVRGSNNNSLKGITHRSSKKKKYSAYRLLKYIESIITKYKDSQYYIHGNLWQYTTTSFDKSTFIRAINERIGLNYVSKRFIKRHELKTLSESSISHPKIRSGYAALRQLLGCTEWDISEEFNHNDEETIIHYTSDTSSSMVQDIVIKQIQNQFVKDLMDFKVRVVESQSLQELRKAINEAKTEFDKDRLIKKESAKLGLDEKTIINIIDAGSEKYILVCEDCTKPSWPGYNVFVKEGQKCRYFNKCVLCNKSIVFPEALPYIARRILDLEKLKSSIVSTEWILLYGDEFDAWNQILSCWSNKKQVNNAWQLAKMGFVELPQIMRGA